MDLLINLLNNFREAYSNHLTQTKTTFRRYLTNAKWWPWRTIWKKLHRLLTLVIYTIVPDIIIPRLKVCKWIRTYLTHKNIIRTALKQYRSICNNNFYIRISNMDLCKIYDIPDCIILWTRVNSYMEILLFEERNEVKFIIIIIVNVVFVEGKQYFCNWFLLVYIKNAV